MDNEIAQTAFFGKSFEEALALVVEARDYVAGRLAFDRETVNLEQQLVVDCETLGDPPVTQPPTPATPTPTSPKKKKCKKGRKLKKGKCVKKRKKRR